MEQDSALHEKGEHTENIVAIAADIKALEQDATPFAEQQYTMQRTGFVSHILPRRRTTTCENTMAETQPRLQEMHRLHGGSVCYTHIWQEFPLVCGLQEKDEYVENIVADIKSLGLDFDRVTYTSDYFPQLQVGGRPRPGNELSSHTDAAPVPTCATSLSEMAHFVRQSCTLAARKWGFQGLKRRLYIAHSG